MHLSILAIALDLFAAVHFQCTYVHEKTVVYLFACEREREREQSENESFEPFIDACLQLSDIATSIQGKESAPYLPGELISKKMS